MAGVAFERAAHYRGRMLHFLRRHSQSRVIQVIFFLIIAVFVLWGVEAVVSGGSPLTTIATVDGQPIEQISIQRAEMNLAQAYRDAYKGQFTAEMQKAMNLRQRALDGLIDRAVLAGQAEKLGYQIDDQELRDSIVDSPAFQVGGRFSKDQYLRVLRSAGLTPADFESAKREDLAVGRLQNLIGDNVTVSDDDVRDDIVSREEKRTLAFVKIPAADLTAQVQVTDADLEKFYEDNRARYAEPDKVKVELLGYPVDKFQDGVEVTEERITEHYETNLETRYTQPHEVRARHILVRVPRDADDATKAKARARIDEVKGKIDAGGDFAALAKEYSDDPGSKEKGGDLGFFPRGRMVGAFDEAAFALKPARSATSSSRRSASTSSRSRRSARSARSRSRRSARRSWSRCGTSRRPRTLAPPRTRTRPRSATAPLSIRSRRSVVSPSTGRSHWRATPRSPASAARCRSPTLSGI